jgi:hypothetical protein
VQRIDSEASTCRTVAILSRTFLREASGEGSYATGFPRIPQLFHKLRVAKRVGKRSTLWRKFFHQAKSVVLSRRVTRIVDIFF